MARSRYSQSDLFKKALKLTGGKGVIKKKKPSSLKGADFPTNISMYANIAKQLSDAYSDKQAATADKADRDAASRMFKDYLKPQKDWNVETDGTTPDALRAATMPGALTGNVGATYDPNVKPKPKEYEYDGEEGQALRMAAALGAPNAALGSPLDPGQPYAVGTDEEGDDANWMSAPEHAEFYKRAAAEAQAGFDVDNPTGMARVDQGNYGVAKPQSFLGQIFGGPAPVSEEQTNTLAMRNLLMGDTIAKRERDEERAYQESLLLAAEERKKTSTALGVTNRRIDDTTLNNRKIEAAERKRLNDQEVSRAKEKQDRINWDYEFGRTDEGKKAAAKVKANHVKTNEQMTQLIDIAKARAGNRPLTLEQGKSGGFALRMDGANSDLDKIRFGPDGVEGTKDDYDPTGMRDVFSGKAPRLLANLTMSLEGRLFRQAKENWVTANLRKESGAVITPSEMDNEVLKYFPESFDTLEIIKQKQDSRDRAYAGMRTMADRAYDIMKRELANVKSRRTDGGVYRIKKQ